MAIVGAGPGGLAAALALQRQGLDVRVFEQREEFRPAGVAIFIWPHGLNALKSFDPETTERVVDAGAVIDTIAIEQLQPGGTEAEELVRIDVAGWSRRMDLPPQIGITWARLTDALRAGPEPGTVFWDTRSTPCATTNETASRSPSRRRARARPRRPPCARACA